MTASAVPTVRQRLWLWGHEAGSHDQGYDLPRSSRITPAEGAGYLGLRNLIMVRYEGRPTPPFAQYAVPFRPLDQLVWSVVGAGGATGAEERDEVLSLARTMPNLTGVMMDDFFHAPTAGDDVGVLSLADLRHLRQRLGQLALWVVLYDYQLDLPVRDHLALCDRVTFWTWEAPRLERLEAHLDRAEALAPAGSLVLGCYLWDYGRRAPMPLQAHQRQCELGLQWLQQGRIQGMIFLASCIADLDLDTVEWTRQWIAAVGDRPLAAG
jgi:hypothetical protein